MAKPLRFALIGAGFWAKYQLAAWNEQTGVKCVAICDSDRTKADRLALEAGVSGTYTSIEELLSSEEPDFVDIVTPPATHPALVKLCAARGVDIVCQKPMAETLEEADEMVAACDRAKVTFLIHENWRWQTPIRAIRAVLDAGLIGKPFRARMEMISGFPVFKNQPYFAQLEKFLLADLGVHLLDTGRFLFGEPSIVFCTTQKVHPGIAGEDVATVAATMESGLTFLCQMAYAENPLERERFPETFLFIEGEQGSLELGPDYIVRVTTKEGTHLRRFSPPRYAWADPAYDLVQASMVPCQADLLKSLRGDGQSETTAHDNLKTMQFVFAAYDSAASASAVSFD